MVLFARTPIVVLNCVGHCFDGEQHPATVPQVLGRSDPTTTAGTESRAARKASNRRRLFSWQYTQQNSRSRTGSFIVCRHGSALQESAHGGKATTFWSISHIAYNERFAYSHLSQNNPIRVRNQPIKSHPLLLKQFRPSRTRILSPVVSPPFSSTSAKYLTPNNVVPS
jgi:hypothetical protein